MHDFMYCVDIVFVISFVPEMHRDMNVFRKSEDEFLQLLEENYIG